MPFELVSTLEALRGVYQVPIGPARFQAYLAAAIGGAQMAREVALPPLVSANPMAKAQALARVEGWLALGAEETAREMVTAANAEFGTALFPQTVKVGLSLLDDIGGGWTNRFINDAARFGVGGVLKNSGWVSAVLWTSQVPDLDELRLVVREALYRAAHAAQHGDPLTLAAMLEQEGRAAAWAGRAPTFDADELAYTRAVIAPHLLRTDQPIRLACFYGDAGARAWGYPPLGLSENAGVEVGLADALVGPSFSLP